MATNPWAIDNAAGLPSYTGGGLRLTTVTPYFAGAGASLGAYSGVRLSGSGLDLLVQAQSSPNMTVKVNTGCFVGQGSISATQGAYTWALDTLTNLTISASHATLDRTDLIVVRVRDANVDTSGQRDGGVVVITGTAGSGTPALPTDASYFVLAQVSVVHAVTSITAGAITDKRTFCAALGGMLPFVSTARPTSVQDGQRGWETDTGLAYRYSASLTKWLREQVTLLKTGDAQFTNQTTLQNDDTLFFSGEASATYAWDLTVGFIGNTTNQLKSTLTYPAGATVNECRMGVNNGGTFFNDYIQSVTSGTLLTSGSTATNAMGTIRLTGIIAYGGTAGTFQFQAAQNVSGASSSWVLRGSQLTYRQTA